ncbi:hypothetical protein H5410_031140 [Solanum commersonii]|uniref:Integrase core domain containing protein n=1 Tax=Solanum commersonii TaxID=4109 RepID=A0A9J5YHJ8_SOLCO|nr:hypothetical protein H5410_031140 [Solanum commersonii]
MILQEMNSHVSDLCTTIISHSSSIKFLEEKIGQLVALVYANLDDNLETHVYENPKVVVQVSIIVTRSGKTLKDRPMPENIDVQRVDADDKPPKEMGETQIKGVESEPKSNVKEDEITNYDEVVVALVGVGSCTSSKA